MDSVLPGGKALDTEGLREASSVWWGEGKEGGGGRKVKSQRVSQNQG